MKRFAWATAVCAGALLMFGPQSRADTTITFDNLTDYHSGTPIRNGYQGLNWSNFEVLNTADFTASDGPNGYANGTVSAPNVAFNGFGNAAAISDGSFVFDSAYFTAAWNDGLTVTVTGYLGGTQVDTTSFLVNTSGPTLETFNWTVDTLHFSPSGGIPHGYGGTGQYFAMDNMVINSPAAVPEPTSVLLLGTLIGVLSLVVRRRAKQGRREVRS